MIHNTATLMTKSAPVQQNRFIKQFNRKERPICTNCGIASHIVDKCFKLHGYPLDTSSQKGLFPSVHSVTQIQEDSNSEFSQIPQLSITAKQCQKLMEFLQTNHHQASTNQVGYLPTNQDHIFSKMLGNISQHFVLNVQYFVFHSNYIPNIHKLDPNDSRWIVDTSATDHMISCVSLFTTITAVKLPNSDLVFVTHIGTIKISEHLILPDVLCVPYFSLNLIFATKLIKHLKCCPIFINNHRFIHNLVKWKLIGVGEER